MTNKLELASGFYPNVDSPEYCTYRKPSLSTCCEYTSFNNAPVGGNTDPTKTKSAFSGGSNNRFLGRGATN